MYTIKKGYSDNYRVLFYNIPENIEQWFSINLEGDKYLVIDREEILYWSKDKKDLEPYIQAKKYNL